MFNWELISITIALVAGILLFAFERIWPGEGARRYRAVPLFFLLLALGSTSLYELLDYADSKDLSYMKNGLREGPSSAFDRVELESRIAALEKKLFPFTHMANTKFPDLSEERALEYLKDDIETFPYMATAPTGGLALSSIKTQKKRGTYILKLEFIPADKSQPPKRFDLMATLPSLSEAKILGFVPLTGSPDNISLILLDSAKKAKLIFYCEGQDPVVEITLSRPAPLKLEGPRLAAPVTISVE